MPMKPRTTTPSAMTMRFETPKKRSLSATSAMAYVAALTPFISSRATPRPAPSVARVAMKGAMRR